MAIKAKAKRFRGLFGKNRLYSLALLILILPFTFSFEYLPKVESDVKETKVEEEIIDLKKIEINAEDFDISNEFSFETRGTASWYGKRFHNRKTANGERYNMHANTAAHKKLPFGTILRVTNEKSGKSTLIRINDRGPYVGRRILDLSKKAAVDIDGKGLPKVKLEGLIADEEYREGYFFVYSYENSPLCLPEEILELKDSTSKFEDAIKKLNQLNDNLGRENYKLIVSASERRRSDKGKKIKYFLGEVKQYRTEKLNIASK